MTNDKLQIKKEEGLSLIEILVVTTIFVFLGIITTRSVLLTLQGSKKTESLVNVRENLNYAMSVVERNLRNADAVTTCPNPDTRIISYSDGLGNPASFSCINIGSPNGYVASGSASLTNTSINITSCSFTCQTSTSFNPPFVNIVLEGVEKNATGVQGASVTVNNKIYLRNY